MAQQNYLPGWLHLWMEERVNALISNCHQCACLHAVRAVRKEVREASPSPDATPSVACMRLWAALALPVMGESEIKALTTARHKLSPAFSSSKPSAAPLSMQVLTLRKHPNASRVDLMSTHVCDGCEPSNLLLWCRRT